MPNPLLTLADRQKAEALRADAAALEQVIKAYGAMYAGLQGDIDALVLAIERMENPTARAVQALPQYKRLVANSGVALDRFSGFLETVVATAALASIELGLSHSSALVNLFAGGTFDSLPADVMTELLNYLRTDGPLYARLQVLTGSTVEWVVQNIIDGVQQGYNPRRIASIIQEAFGRGLTDALRNTRTVQLYSYRESARANYIATDGIVQGWIWYAEIGDPRTCLSCVAQHGTIHGLDETLNDHYNGRCAPIPYIPEFGNMIEQGGEEWFNSLSEAQQQQLMGSMKWQAWKEGKFSFMQLSHEQENEVYGPMRSVASLKQLLNN